LRLLTPTRALGPVGLAVTVVLDGPDEPLSDEAGLCDRDREAPSAAEQLAVQRLERHPAALGGERLAEVARRAREVDGRADRDRMEDFRVDRPPVGVLVTNVSPAANERLIMTGSGRPAARLIVLVRWLRPAAPIGGSLVLLPGQERPRASSPATLRLGTATQEEGRLAGVVSKDAASERCGGLPPVRLEMLGRGHRLEHVDSAFILHLRQQVVG
jgi:hypothetical protein